MSTSSKPKTLILWLDAVAFNKLNKTTTPFLWKLVTQKNWTFVPQQSSFGYSSIPASLVTGKNPNQHKQFAVFRRRKNNEPLSFWQTSAAMLPKKLVPYWYNLGRYFAGEDFFLPAIKSTVSKNVVPAQVKSYPQEGSLPVQTIFDAWRKKNESFLFYNWPLLVSDKKTTLTPLVAANDTDRTALFLKQFDSYQPQHSFVHLWDLDAVGHGFGAGTREFKQTLKNYDQLSQQILSRFDITKDKIVIFADHGMTDVKNYIDPNQLLSDHDVDWFADSTLLRVWSKNKKAMAAVKKILEKQKTGTILSPTQLKKLNLDKISADYFDLLFVLKPGNAFVPTSFLSDHNVKGMHGYVHTDLSEKEWPMVAFNSPTKKKTVTTEDILKLAKIL
jgi:hypothetical protein